MDRPKRIVQLGIVLAVASLLWSAAFAGRARAATDAPPATPPITNKRLGRSIPPIYPTNPQS